MSYPAPPGAVGVLDSAERLPVVPEEVTASWLTKVLGRPVKTVTLKDALHGTASKLLYEVMYEDGGDTTALPTRICIKGGFNPALLKIHPTLNAVYRREAEFYYYIAPTVSMRLPKVWYNGSDTVTGQGIVILDDLKAAGYSFGDPLEAWSVDRVRSGVEELANLHAKTWGAEQTDFPWLKEGLSLREVILSMLAPEPWAGRFDDPAAKPPVPGYLIDRERVIRAYKTLWATTNEKLRCIVHGDSHIGNAFITPAGDPGFLDWQGLHSYSALHDVSYFIVGALTVQDRRENEIELFQHYLNILHKAGGPKLEKDDVWEDYRKHHFHGFAWSLTPPMMQPKEKVDVMTERHCAAIADHKTLELLESLPEYVKEV
ncbi:kinase-like domain-containing protein [Coniochaeta sp. 2T2.1]|nr:kinase-like domain-containing protein [Coniochaeta sp. 2T2.1]